MFFTTAGSIPFVRTLQDLFIDGVNHRVVDGPTATFVVADDCEF